MGFYVGQKVVCVDDSPGDGVWRSGNNGKPTLNAVYTIRETGLANNGEPGVRLLELELTGFHSIYGFFRDNFYRASRFRPLVERKTDISIFKKLLTPSPEKELVGTSSS